MPMSISGSDNVVEFLLEDEKLKERFDINIKGNGNKIKISGSVRGSGRIRINILASDCSINLGDSIIVRGGLSISILPSGGGNPSCDCHVSIGDRAFFNGVSTFNLAESGNKIEIGSDCLLGGGISFSTSDSHPIYDIESNERLNYSSNIYIGKNVWVANNVHFMKKSYISSGSVVGAHSVVTHKYDEDNVVVAGNPARIVKRNIKWQIKDG